MSWQHCGNSEKKESLNFGLPDSGQRQQKKTHGVGLHLRGNLFLFYLDPFFNAAFVFWSFVMIFF